jgi:spermidine/putrescine transport system substrate-binding protein
MNSGSDKSLFGLSPNRREIIKGTTALAGAAAVSGIVPRATAADDNTLTLLTWPGHADAHVVGPFEEQTGIKIIPKEYVGGEAMMSLLQQSPLGTYDVVLTGNAYIEMMRDGGFIEKLDPTDYPIDDFWPEFQNFPTHWLDGDLYSVMVSYGFIGMAYNTEKFKPDDLLPAEHGGAEHLQRQPASLRHR